MPEGFVKIQINTKIARRSVSALTGPKKEIRNDVSNPSRRQLQ
jgi:hypothetical protein